MPDDAGVVRVDEETGRGVAISTDCNSRFAKLDPYTGAQLALAESYRNVATAGADAARRHRLPQLRLAGGPGRDVAVPRGGQGHRRGLQDPRHPGHRRQRQLLQPDRRHGRSTRRRSSACSASWTTSPGAPRRAGRRRPGRLPARRHPRRARRSASGRTSSTATSAACRPKVDLGAEQLLGEILVNASRDGLVDAAHDLSDGGLAVALAEATMRYGVGARIWLDEVCERDGVDAFTALYSESTARVSRSGAALGGGAVHRHVHRPGTRSHARIGVVDDQTDGIDVAGPLLGGSPRFATPTPVRCRRSSAGRRPERGRPGRGTAAEECR